MNILHIGPVDSMKAAGTSVIIPQIVEGQNKIKGVNAALLNFSKDTKGLDINAFNFKYFDYIKNRIRHISELAKPFDKPDIVILHSVYQVRVMPLINEIIRKKIPYILVPHGGMTAEAQRQKRIKKKLANLMFFNRIINKSVKIQYLSEGEAANSLFKHNFYCLGNGVQIPKTMNKKNFKLLSEDNKNFNFLGRLDIRHKGLDFLLEACNISKQLLIDNNVHINLYGPDYNGGKDIIEKYISKNNLENIVFIKGPVYSHKKETMLLNTHIYLLTSRHEGLPTTVLEALSYGIPCLLTPGTNMADRVEKEICGWKTSAEPIDISNNFKKILNDNSSEDIESYKYNAKRFIQENYTWKKVSERAIEEYSKVLKGK